MTDNKKELSDRLLDAMSHENLSTRETAKILNLNPVYISMAKNPNLFNTMSMLAWERIEEWHDSRDKLKDFHPTLLEGEEIWKPKPVVADGKPKTVAEKITGLKHPKITMTSSDPVVNVPSEMKNYVSIKESPKTLAEGIKTPETKLIIDPNAGHTGDPSLINLDPGLRFLQQPGITVGQAIDVLIKAGAKFKVKLDM